MPSPLSPGDIIALANVAWKLGQAFTTGRKSAPAEFREVENQLYSLSAALAALEEAHSDGRADLSIDPSSVPATSQQRLGDGGQVIDNIIGNCRETLAHLEGILVKYGCISASQHSSGPHFKRWSRELVKNWKKIAWTTEKGDLAALRNRILVHANSLNLVLGIVVNSQTTRIETRLEQASEMLKEIHEWYIENLKNATPVRANAGTSAAGTDAISDANITVPSAYTFKLYIQDGHNQKLVCPHVSLNQDWNGDPSTEGSNSIPGPLFVCSCAASAPPESSNHRQAAEAYALSHLTFPARLAGKQRSWVLYKAADQTNGRLVTLRITNIPSTVINLFEETFLQALAMRRAEDILRQGIGNALTYVAPDTNEERILAMIGDLKQAHNSIESVTYSIGQRNYTRDSVDNVQLLQYQTLSHRVEAGLPQTDPLQPLDFVEVLITYNSEDAQGRGDIVRSVLILRKNTSLKLEADDAKLSIEGVESTGYFADEHTTDWKSLNVTFQFTTQEAAKEFHTRLEDMRMELFVLSLQYPRRDEQVVLHLQAAQVECDNIFIREAEITIVHTAEDKYRLIIVSCNKCTILSQVLASDFFTSAPAMPNFASLTWLVQFEDDGTRNVYKYEHGLQHFRFRSRQSSRMFELARSTISMSLHVWPGEAISEGVA